MTGRPSKLTEELLAQLAEAAGSDATIKETCAMVGISQAAWYLWESRGGDDPLINRFVELAAQVRAGAGKRIDDRAWGVLGEVMADETARPSDRIAAASNALRLRTAHRVELSGPGGGPIQAGPTLDLSRLDLEERRQLLELAQKAGSGDE